MNRTLPVEGERAPSRKMNRAARAKAGARVCSEALALAGRDRAKLEKVAEACATTPRIVVADAQDADALLALLASNVRTMATPPEIVIFPPMPYLQKALEQQC